VTLVDSFLVMAGLLSEAVVLLLLVRRRVFRTLPVFTLYLCWSLVSDLGQSAATKQFPSGVLSMYLVSLAIDSLFQFGVLFELSRSVLRPVSNLLPRWTSFAVAALIILICAVIWPFAKSPAFNGFKVEEQLLVHLQQTFSILRILFFLALAGGSQLLSIGWRDRELQVATGLGFYSMVSVAVSVLHTRQDLLPLYHRMDDIVVVSYLCSLLYWIFCFAQQEAVRREFSPQMQNLLLAVAGSARSTRVALTDSASGKPRNPHE